MIYIYGRLVHNGILFSHKKRRNPTICDNTDRLWRHYAKRNKSEKDKYCIMSFMCGIFKQTKNRQNRKAQNVLEKRLELCLPEAEGGKEGEIGGRWSKGTNLQL